MTSGAEGIALEEVVVAQANLAAASERASQAFVAAQHAGTSSSTAQVDSQDQHQQAQHLRHSKSGACRLLAPPKTALSGSLFYARFMSCHGCCHGSCAAMQTSLGQQQCSGAAVS